MLYKNVCELLSLKEFFSPKRKKWIKWSNFHLIKMNPFKVGGYTALPQTKEDMKKPAFTCTKKLIEANDKGIWITQRILETIAYSSCRIEFKNHWIRFDDLENEGKAIWCPDYYIWKNPSDDSVGKKYALYEGMQLNYHGKPLNYDSEKAKKKKAELNNYLDLMRKRTNLMAKARRQDKKAVAAIDYAEETGNYLAVNPADAFKVKNVTTRRKYLSKYSVEEIVESMKYEICDTADGLNGSKYELIKFPVEDPTSRFSMCYYLKMLNVSTDETHLEGVGPFTGVSGGGGNGIEEETVEAALMWRDQEQMHQNIKDGETVHHTYNAPIAIT